MRLDLDNLPHDTALLHRLVRDMAGLVEHRDDEIERLQQIIKQLQRAHYGRRSERLDPDQLALALEELDADIAGIVESRPEPLTVEPTPARRKPLPGHLEREERLLDVEGEGCARCCGEFHPIGESVSEMLDWVPATLRVIRIRRPKYACRQCKTVAQAPAPERVIAGGLATPALLAHVLISKYCDHLPLYRQSQMFARQGVDLERSTLAGWVGGACWWLEALHAKLGQEILASDHLFADDTPIPVLDPGRRRTKTGRLWVYAREQRGWSGTDPPAAIYFYEPDRRAERPKDHLKTWRGTLHVDGYAEFEQLTAAGNIVLAACWAHTRRKFYEIAKGDGSPIAAEAVRRIAELYTIETKIRGKMPVERLALRRAMTRPLVAELKPWLEAQPRRGPLPSHLKREERLIDVEADSCSCCGGALHPIGESVSEMLDWVPASLRVIRIRRPKYACRTCRSVVQAAAPERVIAGGLATPALLSHVLVSKYCDHLPLYRQSRIFARQGVNLERSTLAGSVGGACCWLDVQRDNQDANVATIRMRFREGMRRCRA